MAKRGFTIGDRVIGRDNKASVWGRTGTIAGFGTSGEYHWAFDDGESEYVLA